MLLSVCVGTMRMLVFLPFQASAGWRDAVEQEQSGTCDSMLSASVIFFKNRL